MHAGSHHSAMGMERVQVVESNRTPLQGTSSLACQMGYYVT